LFLEAIKMAQEKEIHPRRGKVEQRINTARDSLPGERNDLPAGSLGGLPTDPQADENRAPPPNAPTIPK
jgi:hypothetical protein